MATTTDPAEAQLLLAHVLGVDQAYLLAHPQPRLSLWQRRRYARLLRRRAVGWPIAYLIGEKWFYGRPFSVNRSVLIPRPETELLVDLALQEIRQSSQPPAIVDVGTGSGCVAVTLAAELGVPVIATDVSRRALAVARRNARRHGVEKLITFLRGSLLEPVTRQRGTASGEQPTILIANLPYLPAGHPQSQTPFEPSLALYGGDEDGLGAVRKLVGRASELPRVAALLLEIDPRQAAAVRTLLGDSLPHGHVEIHNDLAGRPRAAVWIRRGA